MLASSRNHVRHHGRFYASVLVGIVVWALAVAWEATVPWQWWDQPVHLLLAGDAFFGVYVVLMAFLATGSTADELRRRARYEDEGIVLIILIALSAIALSIGSIFAVLADTGHPASLSLALAIASVPLGWLTLHTILAFHYAFLYYTSESAAGKDPHDAGGLQFPETQEPTGWDFLYYSFVLGMTAQVSDVQTASAAMRRLTLFHSIVSFFYNTVILALAVNVAAGR